MNRSLKHAAAAAAFFVIVLCSRASAGDDGKIIVERTGPAVSNEAVPQSLSTLEAEFAALTDRLSAGVTFDVESRRNDTSESSSRKAKVFVKDTTSVRVETSLPGGIELSITKAGNEGWIYFPKTNMIMELKNGGGMAEKAGADFIAGFTANRGGHVINRTDAADSARRYEIAEKSGGRVVSYDFAADGVPVKITVVESDRSSREILITRISFGPVDDSLFARPKNAFKMPVNEFPDFDY